MAKGTTRGGRSRQSARVSAAWKRLVMRFGSGSARRRAAASFEQPSERRGLPLRLGGLCRLAALAAALLLSATPAPAQTTAAARTSLCDVGWHQSARGSGAVTTAVGNGADVVVSLRLQGGAAAARQAVRALRLFHNATSLGGVESLAEHRGPVEGPGSPVPDDLGRLSVGIEDADDLIADLRQALADVG